ncbi:hypothetical protein ACPXCE_26665 [Streptomyces sp. DT24]|uniref:hypothetical protein n=1 Tax=Streptomyces sp. DT24 TaxID=3416520 RepID=UPI003CF55C58
MRRIARGTAVLTAGLVTALILSGCGGDESSDGSDKNDGRKESAASTGGGSDGRDDDSGKSGAAALDGSWAGLTDGKAVVLTVTGDTATLVAGQHVCQGSVKRAERATLALTCVDGDTGRASGTVDSHDGSAIVVSWGGGITDKLTRATGSGLPSTLPSNLPTGMPTGLPSGLPTL